MGVTAFSLFNLFFSLETADEERSLFSGDILQNPTLLKTTALSVAAIVLATELGVFQRLLGTVSLTADQWIICTVVALSIVVVAEVKKALHIRTTEAPVEVASAPAAGAAAASTRAHPGRFGTLRRCRLPSPVGETRWPMALAVLTVMVLSLFQSERPVGAARVGRARWSRACSWPS